jgi:hypothetical protein
MAVRWGFPSLPARGNDTMLLDLAKKLI